ncbi:MAG: GTP-binding protein [Candidatus Lokiarchaeota archaeon]|nr:GTP-binding protein [Candidatus Lokiarchaeota archaeon]
MSFRGKVVLLGDPAVGKTSLLNRYIDDKFPDEYLPTVGANFLVTEVDLTSIIDKLEKLDNELKEKVKNKGLKIYFWDIGGQPDKLFANEYYFLDAVGAIVVFNLVDEESLKNLEFWISKLRELSGEVPFIIVGNKIDLSEGRKISETLIRKKVEEYGVEYHETSAKTNENVKKAFESLSIKILNNMA